jgi:hypothetical protein
MPQPQIELWPQLLATLRQFLSQPAVQQGLPSLTSFEPLPRFVQRKPARPRRVMANERRRHRISPTAPAAVCWTMSSASATFGTSADHVAKNLPLTAQKQRKKSLLRRRRILKMRAWVPGTSLGVFSLPANSQFWTNNFEEV